MNRRVLWVELVALGIASGALGGTIVRASTEALSSAGLTILMHSLLSAIDNPLLALPFYYLLLPLVIVSSGGLGGVVAATPGVLIATTLLKWPRSARLRWFLVWSITGMVVAVLFAATAILAPHVRLGHQDLGLQWAAFGSGGGILAWLLSREWSRNDLPNTNVQN